MTSIPQRLAMVKERMERAAVAAGRSVAEIQLIAVSKRKPASDIRVAYAEGVRDFGENYVQELQAKAQELGDLPDLRWHMIGHLQRNKAKHVVEVASTVQTVDSVALVTELGRRAAMRDGERPPLAVLVEVNVGGEDEKSGCEPAELAPVLVAVEAQPALALRGLMTIPPFTNDPRDARPYFELLARLQVEHGGRQRLPELSMGMTHDLEQAVLAGATMVRVGTAIFGERPPKPAGI